MAINVATLDFAVYENGSDYLGMANITMPDLTTKTVTVNGAGIPGDVTIPVTGQMEAATMTINFTDVTESAYKLAEQRVHLLDLRAMHETYDPKLASLGTVLYQYILQVIPTKLGGGTIAPAAAQAVSGEYSIISRKDFINGKCVLEHDPLNGKYNDGTGNNIIAATRLGLGR